MKKSLKGSGPPRREIVKSFLERKKSVENDKRLGHKTLPERDAGANSSITENCSQTRVRMESYGVTFPDRRNFTSSTSFCLSPNTAEEEEQQLCVAKQLFLGSIPFDNRDLKHRRRNGTTTPTRSEIFPHEPSGHALGCQNVVQPSSTTESEQVFALVKT